MIAGKDVAKGAGKKRGLGRGLEALLGPKAAAEALPLQALPGDQLRSLPVDAMVPGKYQPRRSMDDAKLEELASSIRAQGVIQPIVVREHVGADGKGGRTYEIIAGERRWRASQRAGLSEIPVVVRVVDDRTVVAMALIENIQREDLNPLEEAQALQRLIDEFDLTHAAAAEAVGRSRAALSNLLRPMAISLARQAAEHGWSVREVEHRVQQLSTGKAASTPRKPAAKAKPQADIVALERELSEALGTRIDVLHGRGGKGRLVIHYSDLESLDGVLERLRTRA